MDDISGHIFLTTIYIYMILYLYEFLKEFSWFAQNPMIPLTAEASRVASDLQVVLGAAGDLAKKKCLGAAICGGISWGKSHTAADFLK